MPNPKDGGSTTPASNNLWVGNLTIDTTEADLNDLFRRYGSLDSVTSYSSRNYAFVHYKRIEDARKAKDSLQNALLRGNNIKIEFARPAKPSKNLWVGSISASVTKDQLENEFLKCGRIEEFKFLRDRNSALVEYYRLDDAVAAVKSMNGRRLGGEQIRVDFVKSSRRHKRPADGEGHVSTPQNLLPAHHLSLSQLMISSQYAELVEKANNMGYGRDFAASMIYSMEESGQPLDFNTLFGKIMRQGETSQKSFEAMMKNTGKPPVQRKPQVDLDSRLGKIVKLQLLHMILVVDHTT